MQIQRIQSNNNNTFKAYFIPDKSGYFERLWKETPLHHDYVVRAINDFKKKKNAETNNYFQEKK